MYDVIIDFKCGKTQYRAGERVSPDDFNDDQKVRYVAQGWMAKVGEQPVPAPVGTVAELDIQSLTTTTAAKGL